MEQTQRNQAAAQFHDLIASQPQINHLRRFGVWTLDGVTFHIDCTHKDAPALHYAADTLIAGGKGTRHADTVIPQFRGSYIMFTVKYTPEGADNARS
jgi:hypothetical protein